MTPAKEMTRIHNNKNRFSDALNPASVTSQHAYTYIIKVDLFRWDAHTDPSHPMTTFIHSLLLSIFSTN